MSGSVRPGNSTDGERSGDAEQLFEGPIERPLPGPSGDHQGAVDIEQNQPMLYQAA